MSSKGGHGGLTLWMAVGVVLIYLAVWAYEKITGRKEGME